MRASGSSLPGATSESIWFLAYLGNDTNAVTSTVSREVPMIGNRVIARMLVIALAGSAGTPTLQFTLEGTYDGSEWETIGTATTAKIGPMKIDSGATVTYLKIRVRAAVTAGTAVDSIFNGLLVFSQQ